jgi:uncharacterized membrane protein
MKLQVSTVVLSIIGLLDSLYLTWVKLTQNQVVCIKGLGDCNSVNNSRYSEIFGIPIALLGMGAYLAIIILIWLSKRSEFWEDNFPIIFMGITLIGFLYSGYLTYLELFVLNAICPYCVLSAIIMTLLFIIAILRLVKTQAQTIS